MERWEPQVGERVGIRLTLEAAEAAHGTVPNLGSGLFCRRLGDHERYPYEVNVNVGNGHKGKYTYAYEEIYQVNDGRP